MTPRTDLGKNHSLIKCKTALGTRYRPTINECDGTCGNGELCANLFLKIITQRKDISHVSGPKTVSLMINVQVHLKLTTS